MLACDIVVGRLARCAADRAPRPHAHPRQPARDPGRRVAAQPGCRPEGRRCCSRSCAFAAGADRVETLDAQTLARGRSSATRSSSNIVALGYAWQRGLVPVGLRRDAARDRAERRRGGEQQAGVLARPARGGRPGSAASSCCASRIRRALQAETLDALVARGVEPPHRLPERRLCAALSRDVVRRCASARRRSPARSRALPFTRAVAAQPAAS